MRAYFDSLDKVSKLDVAAFALENQYNLNYDTPREPTAQAAETVEG